MDLDRLRYLAAEGDTQAAAELVRQEQRLGLAIPALLEQLRAAYDVGDFTTARAKVFALHVAGYDQLRWRVCYDVTHIGSLVTCEADVDLITGKHRGVPDHFKICTGRNSHHGFICTHEDLTLTPRRVAFPHRNGLASIPLLWGMPSRFFMARNEMARHALHYGRLVAVWRPGRDPAGTPHADLVSLAALYITNPQHPLLQESTPAHVRELARRLRYGFGTAHPDQRPPHMAAAILRLVLEAQDPDATLDSLRATVTAARVYTRRLLDGITEGEGIATRRDLARMLAAIYCGQDHTITPR